MAIPLMQLPPLSPENAAPAALRPRLSRTLSTLALVGLLASCSPGEGASSSPNAAPAASEGASATLSQSAGQPAEAGDQNPWLITPEGMGTIQVGMTLGDIKAALGEDYELNDVPNFMVDFGAIEVSQGGEVLMALMYFAAEPPTDGDPIYFLWTENPKFRTPEGIGPGSPVADGEAAYGKATLSYSVSDEMREYVRFANQPEDLAFRTPGEPDNFNGIYAKGSGGDLWETSEYRPDATIRAILVDGFRRANASQPPQSNPEPGADQGAYQEADDRLNQVYQQKKGSLSAPDQDALTDVQLQWLRVRDTSCEAMAYDQGGSGPVLNHCLTVTTETRTRHLQQSIEAGFFPEGSQSPSLGKVEVDGNTIDCDNPRGTPEINYCTEVAADRADQALEAVFQSRLDSLSPKAQTLLSESQDAWYSYRQSHCDLVTQGAIGGTGFSAFLNGCREALSLDRAQELETLAAPPKP